MLVLRRREGESILLGDRLEVKVVEIGASRVKLGILAPAEIEVTRKEVAQAQERNIAATAMVPEEGLAELARVLRSGPFAPPHP